MLLVPGRRITFRASNAVPRMEAGIFKLAKGFSIVMCWMFFAEKVPRTSTHTASMDDRFTGSLISTVGGFKAARRLSNKLPFLLPYAGLFGSTVIEMELLQAENAAFPI